MLDDPQMVNQISFMDELDRRPHGDGGEWVEDLLDPLVKLSDVLDRETSVIDLQGSWKIGLSKILHRPVFEVQILERFLESCQAGAL